MPTNLKIAATWRGLVLAAVLAACGGGGPGLTTEPGGTSGPGGGSTGGPVTDLTKLCDLLGPGDFATVGISGAGAPSVNSDGPGSAYCVYAGQSVATGGIEMDVFVDPDAESTFDVITDEFQGELTSFPLPGVDAAVATDGTSDTWATIVVRKGPLVFTIGAPSGTGQSARLATLAGLVVARGAGLVP